MKKIMALALVFVMVAFPVFALTSEQQVVIDKFRQRYFAARDIFPQDDKISLSEFMAKTKEEQIDFIKDWTVEEYDNLTTLEGNLNDQIDRVQTQKAVAEQALEDWGVIVP